MDTNMKELNWEEMKQVNGGFDNVIRNLWTAFRNWISDKDNFKNKRIEPGDLWKKIK